jgi:membrane-associated phospholipid phosphatase
MKNDFQESTNINTHNNKDIQNVNSNLVINDLPRSDNFIMNNGLNNQIELEISDNNNKLPKKDNIDLILLKSYTENISFTYSICLPSTFFNCTTISPNIIAFIIWIICLIVLFSIEPTFRKKLLEVNEDNTVDLQKHLNINFFKFITKFGDQTAIIPIAFIIYLFFPLKTLYAFFTNLFFASYFTNFLKLVYSEKRPYWDDDAKFNSYTCEGGFGNPSGHAYSSTTIYLSIWIILYRNTGLKNNNKIWTVLVLLASLTLIILVLISRVVLAAHSINQILFGSLLGLFQFTFIFYLVDYENMLDQDFYNMFKGIWYVTFHSLFYIALFLTIILLYLTKSYANIREKYEEKVVSKCLIEKKYKEFQNDGLYSGLVFVAIITMYFGMYMLVTIKEKYSNFFNIRNEVNSEVKVESDWCEKFICTKLHQKEFSDILKFNSLPWLKWFYFICISLVLLAPCFALFLISGKNSLAVIYIFKICLPYLLIGFNLTGLIPLTTIALKIKE